MGEGERGTREGGRGEFIGYLSPFITKSQVSLKNDVVFLVSPGVFLDVRIKLIAPPEQLSDCKIEERYRTERDMYEINITVIL